MRRLPALLLTALAVIAVAACSASAPAGWTYAPAPSASAAASGAAPSGAAPSAAPSTAPSVEPSVAPSVAPSASAAESAAASGGSGGALTVKAPPNAASAGFDPTTLETAAGTAFTLTFDNEDTTAPHNLVLLNPDGSKVAVQGDTAFFTGPGNRTYQVPALTAGAYPYKCEVHPGTMMGTLTVK